MDAVATVSVESAGRPKHHSVTVVPAVVGVGGGVGPGTVGNPTVRLHLNDDGTHSPAGDGGTE